MRGSGWISRDVRRALQSFLARERRPGDLVALIATSGRLGGLAQLTNDPRLLNAAVERFRSLPTHRTGVRERVCKPKPVRAMGADEAAQGYYGRLTLSTRRRVVDKLPGLPVRRPILLFSEGMPIIRQFGFGEMDLALRDQYEAFLAHANRSGVPVKTIILAA